MEEQDKIKDYDSEPVLYCSKCLSLKIKYEELVDADYCGDCGCTDIRECLPEEWEKMYENKYGRKFTEKTCDPRKSPIWQMSIGKLMLKISDNPKWENIIREIYKAFPKGLSKSDSIVLFFDKLVKDNKLDTLKGLLYRMKV